MGIAAAAAVVGAGLMWGVGRGEPPPEPAPAQQAEEAPPPAGPPTWVELAGLPRTTLVYVDGVVVHVHDQRVPFPTDHQRHQLRVRLLDDGSIWERELSVNGPVTISLTEVFEHGGGQWRAPV